MVKYCVSPLLSEHKMDVGSTVRSVYTYCDLVEHVPVGDTKAPLLRIVNRKKSDEDGNVHQTFNPVMYVPLQKKCFDSVEINMMTDSGPSLFHSTLENHLWFWNFVAPPINIS